MKGEFKTVIERIYENNSKPIYFAEGHDRTNENLISKLLNMGYTIYDKYDKKFDGFKETTFIMINQNESYKNDNVKILND